MTLNDKDGVVVRPQVNGLVLAGGQSKRMGIDKGAMHWHGKEQRYFIADILREICDEVFISCREEQRHEIGSTYRPLVDSFMGSGPLCGILSALQAYPDKAWLVVACDLPLLGQSTLSYLLAHRDAAAMATTFESPFDGQPEPLITIWEPSAVTALLAHLSDGFSCPRKSLIRNIEWVKVLKAPNPEALMNANTPEDAEKARNILSGQH